MKNSSYILNKHPHTKSAQDSLNQMAQLFRFKFKVFPLSVDNFFPLINC